VIDPNPQDMLSRLARVGSWMWLWWGHLSNSFDGPKDAILVTGKEMRDARERTSGGKDKEE